MKIVNKEEFKKLDKSEIFDLRHCKVTNISFEILGEFFEEYKIVNKEKFASGVFVVFKNAEEKKEFEKKLDKSRILNEFANCLKRAKAPEEVFELIKTWEVASKSPYSYSFYDSNDIDWGYKPEGSLRISDHWNFESCGEKHCQLDTTEEYVGGVWILARYENGIYKELKRF